MNITELYNDVDFVPSWYREAQVRRRRLTRQSMLLLLLIAAMAGLVTKAWHDRSEVQLYHNVLLEQVASTKRQITEATKLQHARQQLARELKIHRRLHRPINYSQVTGTLAHLMPESIALRSLELRTDKLTITRPAAAGSASGTFETTAQRSSDQAWVIAVEVEGLAPSDVEVANFIGALAGNPLFRNVKMIYARQAVRNNLITREFKLYMEVSLDCDYQPLRAGEVADAYR